MRNSVKVGYKVSTPYYIGSIAPVLGLMDESEIMNQMSRYWAITGTTGIVPHIKALSAGSWRKPRAVL
jgi:hypothetical protein